MTISRLHPLRAAVGTAAACAMLGFAASANAEVFCVKDPACPAGGVPKDTPEQAFKAADADVLEDTIRLGPGNYTTLGFSSSNPVDIIGAGIDKTIVTDTDTGSVFWLNNAASSISGLTALPIQPNAHGVDLGSGADATDVSVVAPDSATGVTGFNIGAAGTVLQGIRVDLPDGPSGAGVSAPESGNTWLRDAKITAGTGVEGAVSVRRAIIHASTGLRVFASSMNATNVVITRHPRQTTNYFYGAYVTNGSADDGHLVASNLTIDGGGTGTGIQVESNNAQNISSGTASAVVAGAILRRVGWSIARYGLTAPETAGVDISYSSFDGNPVVSTGAGSITQGSGNHTDNPDPRFIDPAHGDYRLRHDSPLIDAGPPAALLGEENPDLAGHDRVRDSDGNGSTIRDTGAYEYQRLAPAAVDFAAPAQPLLIGDGASFAASPVVDPDGDELSYDWAFGDGDTASGSSVTHGFGSPGSHPVKLTVTDSTGLSSTATHSIDVAGASQGSQRKPAAFITLAKPRCAKAVCRLRGTVKNAGRVRVTIVRRGAKSRTLRAIVKGGRWSVRVRKLRRGPTKFTARALAADGRTASVSRRVKVR